MHNRVPVPTTDIHPDFVAGIDSAIKDIFSTMYSQDEEAFKLPMPSVIERKEYSTYPPADAQNCRIGVTAGKYRFKVQLVAEKSR